MLKLKIAEVIIGVLPKYSATAKYCSDFFYKGDKKPDFEIILTQEDIDYERYLSGENYPESYFETLALSRRIAENLLAYDGMLLHCSAVEVDEKAYLFTAPSGTGKSTHASFYKEIFKNRATIINDDKPIVRKIDGKFFVFGSPWQGKHKIGENKKAKIKGICHLTRGKTNQITKADKNYMISVLLSQTLRPKEEEKMDKLLTLLEEMLDSTDLYLLKCNKEKESAKVSYQFMSGDNNEN